MTTATRPMIDFDHHSERYQQTWRMIAADLHASGSPIARTEHHGGFWVVASWEGARRVAEEWESFTSFNDLEKVGNGGRGQMIPQSSYRLDLGESDPPVHTERRRLEVPFFAPKALRTWRPAVRRLLVEALKGVVERGECDLITEVIVPTAARTALYVTGYGADDWLDAVAVGTGFLLPPDDTDFPAEELGRLRTKFRDMLSQRRQEPTGDLISSLANGTVQGKKLSLEEGESMMNALVFGGFDSVTAATASSLLFLSEHPEYKERVVSEEGFVSKLVEEVLRLNPPAGGTARTATKDVELLGQQIKAGESVFIWIAAANRDPQHFSDPEAFDPERSNVTDHMSFSAGPHRCLGAPLGKIEVAEMVRTITVELQNLQIDRESIIQHPLHGGVNGIVHMGASFTPASPLELDTEVA